MRLSPAAFNIDARRIIARPMINATTGFACPAFCAVVDMENAYAYKTQPQITNAMMSTNLNDTLVDSLNQTYFLHLLVNDKNKVVPPGKSVLSMLMHVNFRLRQEIHPHTKHDLVEHLKAAAHKAFWREVNSLFYSVVFPHLDHVFRQPNCFRLRSRLYSSRG